MTNVVLRSGGRMETLNLGGTGDVTATILSGSADAKGSWVSLGTTSFTWEGFSMFMAGGANRPFIFDIGLGATPDIVFADLYRWSTSSTDCNEVWVPLRIPANTEVQARLQTNTSGVTIRAGLVGFGGGPLMPRGLSRGELVNALSASFPATSVTETGTTPTAWTEIVASTPRRYQALMARLNTANDTTRTSSTLIVEIAVGASGQEKVIDAVYGRNDGGISTLAHLIPCDIPAGTRLSFRVTCSAAGAADALSVILNGLW